MRRMSFQSVCCWSSGRKKCHLQNELPIHHFNLNSVRSHADGLFIVMILPQVHLRKPCDDFYFL